MSLSQTPNCPAVLKYFKCFVCPQDSAAVQILLEMCLPTEEEKSQDITTESLLKSIQHPALKQEDPDSCHVGGSEEKEGSLLSNLREVQCLICCLLHQMFIADPNIAKLVHFQVCFSFNYDNKTIF